MNRVVAAAIAAVLLVPGESAAHRLDEYLQAARLSLSRGHVTLEMDLTPGASIAAAIVALVDRDGDGAISPIEAKAYGQSVVADLRLELDGRPVGMLLTRVAAPSIDEMRAGLGTIQLYAAGDVDAGAGRRLLYFRNNHQPVASVHLVNALIPDDRDVDVVGQTRDRGQQEIRVDYRVGQSWPTHLLWLMFGVATLSTFTTLRRASALAK